MVLACAGGDIDHGNMHKAAEKHFGHLDNTYHKKIPSIFPPTSTEGYSYISNIGVRFTGSEFLYRDDNYPYIYGAIAVEGVHRGHSDYLAMEVSICKYIQSEHWKS
jgi:predicted Zn-dependent peptidase